MLLCLLREARLDFPKELCMVLLSHILALNQASAPTLYCRVPCDSCHPPAHSSLWPPSGTAPSLTTLTSTHLYFHLHPKVAFYEMLPGHTAESHSLFLPPLFLCLYLLILICMKFISTSLSILFLNIIAYIKFVFL